MKLKFKKLVIKTLLLLIDAVSSGMADHRELSEVKEELQRMNSGKA